jgi:ATP-dependent Clp protease ATP-binding subunit ClpA
MWIPSKHLSRLNKLAQHVLTLAREEAQSFNHHYIGTEHVLLGLLREQQGLAAQVLSTLGVELDATRTIIERQMGRGNEVNSEEIDYVPRVRKVLFSDGRTRASREHAGSHRAYAAWYCARGGGVAANVLDHFGVLGKVRQQTFALLSKQGVDSSS